jgi:hypothetical protein
MLKAPCRSKGLLTGFRIGHRTAALARQSVNPTRLPLEAYTTSADTARSPAPKARLGRVASLLRGQRLPPCRGPVGGTASVPPTKRKYRIVTLRYLSRNRRSMTYGRQTLSPYVTLENVGGALGRYVAPDRAAVPRPPGASTRTTHPNLTI